MGKDQPKHDRAASRAALFVSGAGLLAAMTWVFWMCLSVGADADPRALRLPLIWIVAVLLFTTCGIYWLWGLVALVASMTSGGGEIRRILFTEFDRTQKHKLPIRRIWRPIYDLYLVSRLLTGSER